MDASGKSAWGQRPPRVGGANGAPPGRGDGSKRQPKDPMGAPMGARKPHDGAGRRAPKNDGYSEELYTTKLDTSKFTEEQIRKAEMLAAQIERENKSGKVNRKMGEYEDAADEPEPPVQPAPPPPANNASTFPALGSAGGNAVAEPAKAPPQSAPQQLHPSDPAVLQMGPTAGSQSTPAGAGGQASGSKGTADDKSCAPLTGGPPMGGQMQLPPGMASMMRGPGPGPGMAHPSHIMQPGQAGAAGWQGGNINNQPPNAGMNGAGAVAGSDGPGGMPSDPMMQMQAPQLMMMQQHMHMMMQQIGVQSNNIERLERERNDHYRQTSLSKDIEELLQKKESLRGEISNMEQHRNMLQNQISMMQMRMMPMHPGQMQHPGQMDKGAGAPLSGAPDAPMMNPMGMGAMPMDHMMAHPMMMQHHMMMQQHMHGLQMQQMQGRPMQQQQPMSQQQQPQPQPPQQPQPQQSAQGAPQPDLPVTTPADALHHVAAPAAVTPAETAALPQTVAEQIVAAAAAAPNSITAPAPVRAAPAATAAQVAHTNGTPDTASYAPPSQQVVPQAQPQPQAQPAAPPQARGSSKGSASDADILQNLKRQLLHLKKETDHREYFDLDNMTIQQLESTIKRVREANGISSVQNNDRAVRGRGRGSASTENGSRPGDEWEVVAPTKKGAMRSNAAMDEKKVQTFRARDRNGMTDNILNGLFMFPDFLSAQEENQLLNFVEDQVRKGERRELQGMTFHKAKNMSAQLHYGVFYNMAENAPGSKQVEPMPEELNKFVTKLINEGILTQKQRPNTAVVCVMEEGDGMLPRVDSKEFARPLCTLSLQSDGDMLFGDKSGQIESHGLGNMDGYALPVPRRSVVRLDDLVANDVQHAITPVKMKRVTITFRQQTYGRSR